MNTPVDIARHAITRYRAIHRVPLEVSSDEVRGEMLEAADIARRAGRIEKPPSWWTGECEYLLRVRGRGPEVFFVVTKDEGTGQLVVVTVHSYEDMSRFERRQGQAIEGRSNSASTLARDATQRDSSLQQSDTSNVNHGDTVEEKARSPFHTALSGLDADRLSSIVDAGLCEGRQLELKQQLPGGGERDKHEFLADVSSFANAAGGELLFGISERRDSANQPTGRAEAILGLPGANLERERLRLESMILTGLDPRLDVQFVDIRRDPSPPCLLIRVPRSWSGLHMVKSSSRFYGRTSAGKYQLDVREISSGFLLAATVRDRAAAFRAERVGRIVSGETPVPVSNERKLILHAIPLGTDEQTWGRFMTEGHPVVVAMKEALVSPLSWSHDSFGSGDTFNLNGFLVYTSVTGARYAAYAQLFRQGALEIVLVEALDRRTTGGGRAFSGSQVEFFTIAAIREVLKAWRGLGIVGPALIGLTLTGLRDCGLALDKDVQGYPKTLLDRDPFLLPEILVDDLQARPEAMLRPLFDLLWNAGGFPRSPNYQGETWSRH